MRASRGSLPDPALPLPQHAGTTEDLSTVIAAVKPRDRTDQFKILAAMYALDAVRTPVTAAAITEALKLQLGKKIPANVPARLRDYEQYVRIADKGPPLTWALKAKGVQRLRSITCLSLPLEAPREEFKTDVGIICALEYPEFAAVIEAFGGDAAWHDVGDARYAHVYRTCAFKDALGRPLSIVGATSSSMGLTAASIVTTQLIMQFRPRLMVMVGIAAGTRDGNKEFGDVLVADPSIDYNSGKVVRSDGIRGFLPDPYPLGLNARLRSLLQRYRGAQAVFEDIRTNWNGRLPSRPNRLHLGPLGAADQVIDDESRLLEIQQNWRKLIGVEMETYGVYRAAHEAPEPKPRYVSFKAVCDFAAEKGDAWQEYAAFMAAQFTARFIAKEWDSLWTTK